jgi:hypothetical protein
VNADRSEQHLASPAHLVTWRHAFPVHPAPALAFSPGNFPAIGRGGTVSDRRQTAGRVESRGDSTLEKFAKQDLRSNQLAVTVVDLRAAGAAARASYRGDVQIYPASVIKLFYLAAAHRWMEDGKLADAPELRGR